MPKPRLSLDEARRVWSRAQAIDSPLRGETLESTLAQTGWSRTLGGVEAYLSLDLRRGELGGDEVSDALETGRLRVVPAARSCIYLVPSEHASLALSLARGLSRRTTARNLEKAGVDDAEIADVSDAILDALQDGAASTNALRKKLPADAIRSLGDAGKKVGITSTLPPALRALEFSGKIRRAPEDHRLDHERYVWTLSDGAQATDGEDEDAIHRRVAELYFRWAGPATRKEFAAWSGLNQTQAKAAIASCELIEVEVEGLGDAYLSAAVPMPDAAWTDLAWVPALDNLYMMREGTRLLADAHLHQIELSAFSSKRVTTIEKSTQPLERTLVWDGRLVGAWAYDPSTRAVVTGFFDNVPSEAKKNLESRAAQLEAIFETLGSARAFSLDKDETLARRADHVRTFQ